MVRVSQNTWTCRICSSQVPLTFGFRGISWPGVELNSTKTWTFPVGSHQCHRQWNFELNPFKLPQKFIPIIDPSCCVFVCLLLFSKEWDIFVYSQVECSTVCAENVNTLPPALKIQSYSNSLSAILNINMASDWHANNCSILSTKNVFIRTKWNKI